ncbi:MAG: hypothetical protein ABEK29_08750 [Bradymonadaceae bacterium]
METDELDLDQNDVIENYLIKTEFPFERVDEGFWLIHDEFDQIDNIVIYHSPPVVTFRVKLLEVPDLDDQVRLELFTKLLELNATSMVAGAYGLEDESVVAVDTLQAENIDFNEFQASIDSMALAIREHYRPLRRLVRGESGVDAPTEKKFESLDEALGAAGESLERTGQTLGETDGNLESAGDATEVSSPEQE